MRLISRSIPRAAFVGILSLLMVISVMLPMGQSVLANDDNSGKTDLSLYQRASELTRVFATDLAPGSGVENLYVIEVSDENYEINPVTGSGRVIPGNAGAFLGYAEVLQDDKAVIGWLMNQFTTASATITYDQLMHVVDTGVSATAGEDEVIAAAGKGNPFFQYAGYGETLTEMGLVKTTRSTSFGSRIGSGLMIVAYLLAQVAPFIFNLALTILVTLNPFKLFTWVIDGTSTSELGVISTVAKYVGDIYSTLQDFSLFIMLPILLVITVLSILMFNKGDGKKKIARYALRVFMIFAGLPLIGATYTGVIEDMKDQVEIGSEYADYLVLSSYVDFENWVKYSRLAPPTEQAANTVIKHPRYNNDDSDLSVTSRELVLAINGERAAIQRATDLKNRYNATSNISDIFSEGGAQIEIKGDNEISKESKSAMRDTLSILTRHFNTARYTSSDYEGEVAGQIQRIIRGGSKEDEKAIMKMFTISESDARTWKQKLPSWLSDDDDTEWLKPMYWNGEDNEIDSSAKGLFTEKYALNDEWRFGRFEMNIYNSGDLRYNDSEGYHTEHMDAKESVGTKTAPIGIDRGETVGGLSPITMYNFLNTTFTSTGLTVFSPSKSSSDITRDTYVSVAFAGSGVSMLMKWMESVAVMLSLAVIAITYGIIMLGVAFRAIPRILTGAFGTAFGSIALITKLLISVGVLILQVIGTIFLYGLSEDILMSIILGFDSLMGSGANYFKSVGIVFEFLNGFLTTVIVVGVAIFMIKNAKIFTNTLEEAVSSAINRLMSGLDSSTGGKGLDVADTSGGRIGQNGQLSDGAKLDDSTGLLGDAAKAVGLGGAAGILKDASDLEGKREANSGEKLGVGDKLKNRLSTAKNLAAADRSDKLKGLGGVDGKAYDREKEAIEQSIKGDNFRGGEPHNQAMAGGEGADDIDDAELNTEGQKLNKDGSIMTGVDGDAYNRKGEAISPEPNVKRTGPMDSLKNDNGELIASDNSVYTDENGVAFKTDSKGHLINDKGEHVALDKDGTLQPIGVIPGGKGKPVNATSEARKLDRMRSNPETYADMKNAQDATHHGKDAKGNLVTDKGKPMMVNGVGGKQPASLDGEGFVTDTEGNRVSKESVRGGVDARGFAEVYDAETGQTHLQHKGDAALKDAGVVDVNDTKGQNVTALSKQAEVATGKAVRAQEKVEQLSSQGAPEQQVRQAKQHASRMNQQAQAKQQRFANAVTNSGMEQSVAASSKEPVTASHLNMAKQNVQSQRSNLDTQSARLEQMQQAGATPQEMQSQRQVVEQTKAVAQQAQQVEQDLQVAHSTGRTIQDVSQVRQNVNSAENNVMKAQQSYDKAIASGAPRREVQQRQQSLNQANNAYVQAQTNMSNIQQKPRGTKEQIAKVDTAHRKANNAYQKATRRVNSLMEQGAPSETLNRAQNRQTRAEAKVKKAVAKRNTLLQPQANQASVAPTTRNVGHQSPSQSRAALMSEGVTTYAKYQQELSSRQQGMKDAHSKVQQAQRNVSILQTNGASQSALSGAESDLAKQKNAYTKAQSGLKSLQTHAQAFAASGDFRPTGTTSPIRMSGDAVANQMINLGNAQQMYERLSYQHSQGTLTQAQEKQMDGLDKRIKSISRDLSGAGVNKEMINDTQSTMDSARTMQQEWDRFKSGQ